MTSVHFLFVPLYVALMILMIKPALAFAPADLLNIKEHQKVLLTKEQSQFETTSFPIEVCGQDVNTFQLHELITEPETPRRGEHLRVIVTGQLGKEVNAGATLDVKVRVGRLPLLTKRLDLCDELNKAPSSPDRCPFSPGEKRWQYDVDLPREIPPVR